MEYNEEDYLLISGIQHFCFCRRQWALIHIEQQWNDNSLTAYGRIVHERVHDRSVSDIRDGILTVRGMQVKSASLGFTGECDAVEFVPSEEGISLFGREGKWLVRPVEYKNGISKMNDCDRLQTVAQVMCLEEMFSFSIEEAHIFYNKTRRREKFAVTSELREQVKEVAVQMHKYYDAGYTPSAKQTKKCASCSLKDICLPKLLQKKKNGSVSDYIAAAIKEDEM